MIKIYIINQIDILRVGFIGIQTSLQYFVKDTENVNR